MKSMISIHGAARQLILLLQHQAAPLGSSQQENIALLQALLFQLIVLFLAIHQVALRKIASI
jgi:hypothetical protein